MEIKLAIVVFALGLGAAQALSLWDNLLDTNDPSEWDATFARNLRSECRVIFSKANEAQNQMFKMENEDDVNGYEKYLGIMRESDKKLAKCVGKYTQVRNFLEAKIWRGELIIDGFNMNYEKSTIDSLKDHLTGKVKY